MNIQERFFALLRSTTYENILYAHHYVLYMTMTNILVINLLLIDTITEIK